MFKNFPFRRRTSERRYYVNSLLKLKVLL